MEHRSYELSAEGTKDKVKSPGALWLHRGPQDFYHISVAFLTKTVPDGVHDGEDEVEAVADVESDQDVVEAVAHLFP